MKSYCGRKQKAVAECESKQEQEIDNGDYSAGLQQEASELKSVLPLPLSSSSKFVVDVVIDDDGVSNWDGPSILLHVCLLCTVIYNSQDDAMQSQDSVFSWLEDLLYYGVYCGLSDHSVSEVASTLVYLANCFVIFIFCPLKRFRIACC